MQGFRDHSHKPSDEKVPEWTVSRKKEEEEGEEWKWEWGEEEGKKKDWWKEDKEKEPMVGKNFAVHTVNLNG